MKTHDPSYKLLFSHPQMVRDLLVGFVAEPWVAELDFATLEQVSGSYVADDLRDREDDLLWRVRFRDRWLYLYLVLEFQARVDPWMAVRLLIGLLYRRVDPVGASTGQACRSAERRDPRPPAGRPPRAPRNLGRAGARGAVPGPGVRRRLTARFILY